MIKKLRRNIHSVWSEGLEEDCNELLQRQDTANAYAYGENIQWMIMSKGRLLMISKAEVTDDKKIKIILIYEKEAYSTAPEVKQVG